MSIDRHIYTWLNFKVQDKWFKILIAVIEVIRMADFWAFPDLRLQASDTCECSLGKRPIGTLTAKGKRPRSDSRWEILKIENDQIKKA